MVHLMFVVHVCTRLYFTWLNEFLLLNVCHFYNQNCWTAPDTCLGLDYFLSDGSITVPFKFNWCRLSFFYFKKWLKLGEIIAEYYPSWAEVFSNFHFIKDSLISIGDTPQWSMTKYPKYCNILAYIFALKYTVYMILMV